MEGHFRGAGTLTVQLDESKLSTTRDPSNATSAAFGFDFGLGPSTFSCSLAPCSKPLPGENVKWALAR